MSGKSGDTGAGQSVGSWVAGPMALAKAMQRADVMQVEGVS